MRVFLDVRCSDQSNIGPREIAVAQGLDILIDAEAAQRVYQGSAVRA